jgi:hypothetical protein
MEDMVCAHVTTRKKGRKTKIGPWDKTYNSVMCTQSIESAEIGKTTIKKGFDQTGGSSPLRQRRAHSRRNRPLLTPIRLF